MDNAKPKALPYRRSRFVTQWGIQVTIENETWFPDDLIAYGEMSGDDTLKGTSYAANAFLQDPFNEGRVVRIEGTNYFVLEATAK